MKVPIVKEQAYYKRTYEKTMALNKVQECPKQNEEYFALWYFLWKLL